MTTVRISTSSRSCKCMGLLSGLDTSNTSNNSVGRTYFDFDRRPLGSMDARRLRVMDALRAGPRVSSAGARLLLVGATAGAAICSSQSPLSTVAGAAGQGGHLLAHVRGELELCGVGTAAATPAWASAPHHHARGADPTKEKEAQVRGMPQWPGMAHR